MMSQVVSAPLASDQLLERGLIADRIEVGIILCVRAKPLRAVDCAPEAFDRISRPPRKALATGEVVEQPGVLRMSRDQLTAAIGRLGVLARAVERVQRGPEFPAIGLVRLSRGAAEREDRRLGLLGKRRPLHAGRRKHESPGGRSHPVAVELEYGPASHNEVQLLGRVRLGLVMLVDDPVARVTGGPGGDPEGGDAEVVPNRSKWLAPVVHFVDLVQSRDCVARHWSPLTSYVTCRRDLDARQATWMPGAPDFDGFGALA